MMGLGRGGATDREKEMDGKLRFAVHLVQGGRHGAAWSRIAAIRGDPRAVMGIDI